MKNVALILLLLLVGTIRAQVTLHTFGQGYIVGKDYSQSLTPYSDLLVRYLDAQWGDPSPGNPHAITIVAGSNYISIVGNFERAKLLSLGDIVVPKEGWLAIEKDTVAAEKLWI